MSTAQLTGEANADGMGQAAARLAAALQLSRVVAFGQKEKESVPQQIPPHDWAYLKLRFPDAGPPYAIYDGDGPSTLWRNSRFRPEEILTCWPGMLNAVSLVKASNDLARQDPAGRTKEEILQELVSAIWLGELTKEDGSTALFTLGPPEGCWLDIDEDVTKPVNPDALEGPYRTLH